MTTLAERAAQLAGRGWPVFPLVPRTKVPRKDSNGVKDATTDAATVASWWHAEPNANIALARIRYARRYENGWAA